MNDVDYPLVGSCQCGQLRYRLLAPPLKVLACHCKHCQKLSTSAFSITAVMRVSDVEFEGELAEWRRMADSGNKNYAKFCPGCGNRIYHYNPDTPDTIKLKAASGLDDTRLLKPTAHLWLSQKQAWFTVPEGVESFDKQGGV